MSMLCDEDRVCGCRMERVGTELENTVGDLDCRNCPVVDCVEREEGL